MVSILKRRRGYIAFISFAMIGSLLILVSRAETPYTQTELENATLSNGATVLTDANASGGNAIVFNSTSPSSFVHPGILVSQQQLDFVKQKIATGQEPWKTAYDKMRTNGLASRTYTPKPVPKLMCSTSVGLNEGFPQAGCTELNNDGAAAYTQALMYYYSGDVTYANNVAKIINAWSSTLAEIPYEQPRTTNGEPAYWQNLLVVGWSTETMTRGAEIVRYTSSAMNSTDIARYEDFLKNKIYPLLSNYTSDGAANGGQTWTESLINIGVYTNDRTIYDKGISWYRQKAKELVYITTDGTQPTVPLNINTGKLTYGTPSQRWYSPTKWVNGQVFETCRDMGHTFMGLGPFSNIAETARIQGLDLYNEQKDRYLASFELNTVFVNEMIDYKQQTGYTERQISGDDPLPNGTTSTWMPSSPDWPCSNYKWGGISANIGQEIAYNHFVNRMGIQMPNTKKLLDRNRVTNDKGNHLFWETLTHYQAP